MNRLQYEKSPYLLQHATNPVDWYPWGDDAFSKARTENKPIFLSVGYSTCHWCHVMERESFEDEEVAGLLNEYFVSIKVDREERPDIDTIYMTVCQAMTGRGGWPLTIFMTPDKKPFFAATYIPKDNRFGTVGMKELLPRIDEVWKTKRDHIIKEAERIREALHGMTKKKSGEMLNDSTVDLAFEQLNNSYDHEFGGFSKKPKFPTPHNLMFLLRYWKRTGKEEALRMVEHTLMRMSLGGIFDHVGGGFHRYSTDEKWLLPHFEKMLYDQAMLILAFTEAYQITGSGSFAEAVSDTIRFLKRDMLSPEGGFFSAWDADSEGEEGKFYVWEKSEIVKILGKERGELFCNVFDVQEHGNFRDEATGAPSGKNILHLEKPLNAFAETSGMSREELILLTNQSKEELFRMRQKRIHPHRDDKVLADWNGLIIAALSKAYQVFNVGEYLTMAEDAAGFIMKNLRDTEGRLFHRWREGEAAIHGFLDDYAFLVFGLIELYGASLKPRYLQDALSLTDEMITLFLSDDGGFFFSARNTEEILMRNKEIYDGAVPSGNSVAALNLLRLSRLTGRTQYEDIAEKIFTFFSHEVSETPIAFTYLMTALDFALGQTIEIVIAGREQSPDVTGMLETVRKTFLPGTVMIFVPSDYPSEIIEVAPFTKELIAGDEEATAYVCKDFTCSLPIMNAEELKTQLI